MFIEILLFLAVFGAVILLSYYTTRFVALKAGSIMRGKHIKIIDVVPLGTDKKLYLVKAGNKCFLLSSSGKNIQLISEVNDITDDTDFKNSGKDGTRKEFALKLERLKNLIYKKEETGDRGQNENTKDF